jgi:glycosyltransferase involved in cell wall biosynthesis
VEWLGFVSRQEMRAVFSRARIGLIIHHPVKNYLIGYPTKLFEYMSAGLPVVCSDFPVLRELDEGVGCCLHVDPLDPNAIAKAIVWLLDNPVEAEAMGRRGRKAVREKYSWEAEEGALLSLYERILKP